MKYLAALAVACTYMVIAPTVSASTLSPRALSDSHVGRSKPELLAQRDYSTRVVRKLTGSWKVAPRHATCWSHVPWSRTCDRSRRRLLAHRWLERRAVTLLDRLFPSHPVLPAWLVADLTCIHGYEGAWNDDTGNGYYGGLQMDIGFQQLYGAAFLARWGTADRWPIWAQLQAAARAYASGRGFGPWPNTARACGLL